MSNKKSKRRAQIYRSGYEAGYLVNVDYVKMLRKKLDRANNMIKNLLEDQGSRALQGHFCLLQYSVYVSKLTDFELEAADYKAHRYFKELAMQKNVITVGSLWSNKNYSKIPQGKDSQEIKYYQYTFIIDDPRLKMENKDLDRYRSFESSLKIIPPLYEVSPYEEVSLEGLVSTNLPSRRNTRKNKNRRTIKF